MPRQSERLFIGLWPDEPVRQALAAWRDAHAWPAAAKLVADDKLHMTLHFLGDVPIDAIAGLRSALALPFEPFTLTIEAATLWHRNIAVLEPRQPADALLALHEAIGGVLDQVGIAREARAYRPHVTLARQAAGVVPAASAMPLVWPVAQFALVASRGGVYETLQRYPAGA
jgi:2'-5' RNA ligase